MRNAILTTMLLAFSFSIGAQVAPQAVHGTVNILLANHNGLVAVADSALSVTESVLGRDRQRTVGYGQKLFRIDDHTICAIAGFYMDPGPSFGSQKSSFAYTAIPNLLHDYLEERPDIARRSLTDKIESLTNSLIFGLEIVANLNQAAGIQRDLRESQVTFAGYENGDLIIARVNLVPQVGLGGITYVKESVPPIRVGERLASSVAGLGDVALDALSHPDKITRPGPNLQFLAESLKADHGASLSVDDMTTIAKAIEWRTANTYPNVVGGKREVAVLSGGTLSAFNPYEGDQPKQNGRRFNWLKDSHARNPNKLPGATGITVASPTNAVFVSNSDFEGRRQPLDNILFTRSTFTNCVLTYDGAPMVLFDKTNIVENSTLEVGAQVKDDDPFIIQLKLEHPGLKIERSH